MEYFIEFAQFEKQYLLIVMLFDLPVLHHCGRELSPLLRRDEQRERVVARMVGSPLLRVHYIVFLDEVRPCVLDLVQRVEAASDHLVLGIHEILSRC